MLPGNSCTVERAPDQVRRKLPACQSDSILGIRNKRHVASILVLPCVAAIDALWLVHAEEYATFWAGPFCCFLVKERIYPDSLYSLQICDDAHVVLGSVPAVKA